jgi:hypothetical protein
MTTQRESGFTMDYDHLITLWTSGVRDYHSMLSDYLTANSIFVAVIGLILSRESPAMSLSLTVLILLLCIFGILLCLQMAIVLGRLTGQNALWEWKLRGIELTQEWQGQKLVTSLYRLHETRQPVEDMLNEPPVFKPNWAFRQPIAPSVFPGFSAASMACSSSGQSHSSFVDVRFLVPHRFSRYAIGYVFVPSWFS